MTVQFQGVLESITRVRGVRGAMLVASDEGLVVADTLMEGVRGNAVAALTANLVKRLGEAMGAARLGRPAFLQLQASEGVLLALPAGEEMLVVAVTEPRANVGLVRLEMLRASAAVT